MDKNVLVPPDRQTETDEQIMTKLPPWRSMDMDMDMDEIVDLVSSSDDDDKIPAKAKDCRQKRRWKDDAVTPPHDAKRRKKKKDKEAGDVEEQTRQMLLNLVRAKQHWDAVEAAEERERKIRRRRRKKKKRKRKKEEREKEERLKNAAAQPPVAVIELSDSEKEAFRSDEDPEPKSSDFPCPEQEANHDVDRVQSPQVPDPPPIASPEPSQESRKNVGDDVILIDISTDEEDSSSEVEKDFSSVELPGSSVTKNNNGTDGFCHIWSLPLFDYDVFQFSEMSFLPDNGREDGLSTFADDDSDSVVLVPPLLVQVPSQPSTQKETAPQIMCDKSKAPEKTEEQGKVWY